MGDECYRSVCIKEKIPTGASHKPEKSKAFIKEYAKEKYTIHYCRESAE